MVAMAGHRAVMLIIAGSVLEITVEFGIGSCVHSVQSLPRKTRSIQAAMHLNQPIRLLGNNGKRRI
jgi:hypothetical protein